MIIKENFTWWCIPYTNGWWTWQGFFSMPCNVYKLLRSKTSKVVIHWQMIISCDFKEWSTSLSVTLFWHALQELFRLWCWDICLTLSDVMKINNYCYPKSSLIHLLLLKKNIKILWLNSCLCSLALITFTLNS